MILKNLFYYCSHNRRSDKTVIEIVLGWTDKDERAIRSHWEPALEHIRDRSGFELAGIFNELRDLGSSGDAISDFMELLARLALAIQQACGHAVDWHECKLDPARQTALVLFEHEETSVGEQAGVAALLLLEQAFPGVEFDLGEHRPTKAFAEYTDQFREHARKLVQPADTSAIISAARMLEVPVIKLERDPYQAVQGDFRIRMNSMLMLGHCAQRQVIDGTFAIERSGKAAPLLGDHHQTYAFCQGLGIPAVAPGQTASPTLSILIANHELCLLKNHRTGLISANGATSAVIATCIKMSHTLDAGLLEVQLVSGIGVVGSGAGESDSDGHGVRVLRINPAPRLDELCADEPEFMQKAATQFVRWLVPAGKGSRIPIAAVTGTNGKTTTSRMIARIVQESGRNTGLQCTDGRYFNGELVESGDSSTLMGHYRLFEDRRVEAAVLETHHRGMAEYGFSFDWCDVAVCTNVTYEHIGYSNIQSVAEMAELKRSLPERARKRAVLNADNDECLAMAPHLNAPVCLVSATLAAEQLFSKVPEAQSVCVLEQVDGKRQIIHYPDTRNQGQGVVVMPVDEIPATFGGAARFNVLNAMQAISAAKALGISDDDIRSAMAGFSMNEADTPWRINFYDGLPFKVLVDFAHNPDGALQLADFANNIEIPGKRFVAFSSFRSDEAIYQTCDNISGRYDHYFVKEYGLPPGVKETVFVRPKGKVIEMIHSRLLGNGIGEQDITVIADEMECVKAALDYAEEGDLVVLMLGYTGLEVIGEFMEDYTRSHHLRKA